MGDLIISGTVALRSGGGAEVKDLLTYIVYLTSMDSAICFVPDQYRNGLFQHTLFNRGWWRCAVTGIMLHTSGTTHVMYHRHICGKVVRYRVTCSRTPMTLALPHTASPAAAYLMEIPRNAVMRLYVATVVSGYTLVPGYAVVPGDVMRRSTAPPYVHSRCNLVMMGSMPRHLECMRPLYEDMTCNPGRRHGGGITALMWAVMHKCEYVTHQMLYKLRVNVMVVDDLGRTALHWAVLWNAGVVAQLMALGADVNAECAAGCTPLDVLFEKGGGNTACAIALFTSLIKVRVCPRTVGAIVARSPPSLVKVMVARGDLDSRVALVEMCRYSYVDMFHIYARDVDALPDGLHVTCVSTPFVERVFGTVHEYQQRQCNMLRVLHLRYHYTMSDDVECAMSHARGTGNVAAGMLLGMLTGRTF